MMNLGESHVRERAQYEAKLREAVSGDRYSGITDERKNELIDLALAGFDNGWLAYGVALGKKLGR